MGQLYCYETEIRGRGASRNLYVIAESMETACKKVQATLDHAEKLHNVKSLGKAIE